MKKSYLLAYTSVVFLLTGCMGQYQEGFDRLNSAWQIENNDLYNQAGVRYYNISANKAHRAMITAATSLGLIVEQQDASSGFILAKGNAPSPLSIEEWKEVEFSETPKAATISGIPGMQLKPTNQEVILNIITLPRKNDVQVSIRARLKYTGETYGLMIGDQPPPLATKFALSKMFDTFEKTAFVQRVVIDNN